MAELVNWSQPLRLGDRSTSDRPVIAGSTFQCMAWRDTEKANIRVSISKDNCKTWSNEVILNDRASQNGPALCYMNSKFIMAWRGLEQDNIWISDSTDGLNWSPQRMLNDRATNVSPKLGGEGNLAIMCWKGFDQNNIWISTSSNGIDWSSQQLLNDRFSKSSPWVAAAKGKYLMSWQGNNENASNDWNNRNIFVSTSQDGQKWSLPIELRDREATDCPAIAFIPSLKTWYMAWREWDQSNIWVSYSENGSTWTPKVEIKNLPANSEPSLCATKNNLRMIWRGSHDNAIYTSSLSFR